jgi:hypothetical protein
MMETVPFAGIRMFADGFRIRPLALAAAPGICVAMVMPLAGSAVVTVVTPLLGFECRFMCFVRWSDREKACSQNWHWNFFSPASTISPV